MEESPTPQNEVQPLQKERNMPIRVLGAVVGVFALLVLIVMFVVPDHKLTVTASVKSVGGAEVSVSDGGFTPSTLSVKPGTTVTWTNASHNLHQVAADPYPKDDGIPGFVSTRVLKQGDTYSFTFTQAGTFTYHDDKNPLSSHATVIVQ